MAKGANLIQWRDRNWAEHGHYVYRSQSPMNPNSLPSPIGSVGRNVTEYIDYDVIEGETYYYRIAAFRNNDIVVSDEIELIAEPMNLGPGPQDLIAGNSDAGFFGEVPVEEFISGESLANIVSFNAGSIQHEGANTWLKFSYRGNVLLTPKKPFRNNLSWVDINDHDLVYGRRVVNINDNMFKVRLFLGGNSDPASGPGREWDELIVPVSNGVFYNYTTADLDAEFGGTDTWCQETSESSISSRVLRGYNTIDRFATRTSFQRSENRGWRPVLEMIFTN